MVDARSVCPIQACTVLRSIPPCRAWVAKVARDLWSHQVSGSIPGWPATADRLRETEQPRQITRRPSQLCSISLFDALR
jgi:hypothetical protein